MVTNKALTELEYWAREAGLGNGDAAKQHLEAFYHIGAGLINSPEFQERCKELFWQSFAPDDLKHTCEILDAIANIECLQVQKYGPAYEPLPLYQAGRQEK
jgi:hypothetical protein